MTCRYCDDSAEYLVLGADQRMGDECIPACSLHLSDAVGSVTAPAQVWPA